MFGFFKKKSRIEREIDLMLAKTNAEAKVHMALRNAGIKPMQYKRIQVPDWNKRTEFLSGFRKAYADYFSRRIIEENSDLQNYSTQMFWHRLYLQKLRMKRLGITMAMESERVRCSEDPMESIGENSIFDGRYMVDYVNEAIYSKRVFLKDDEEIGTFHDYESVNYSILSAKQQGESEIICPSCGNVTTRENLIDGCDYCGTKFTIEDFEDRVGAFDFVFEIAIPDLQQSDKTVRRNFDERAGKQVRKHDENFSFINFKANVFNKMASIHFANSYQQISAFADEELAHLIGEFDEVVNIDFDDLFLWDKDYWIEDGLQKMKCSVHMVLFGLVDGKIRLRNEVAMLELEKYEDCVTQNICGPSVFRCEGCGNSLSLMDGKACPYCGRELDLRAHDWVITKYESRSDKADYETGKSWREFN